MEAVLGGNVVRVRVLDIMSPEGWFGDFDDSGWCEMYLWEWILRECRCVQSPRFDGLWFNGLWFDDLMTWRVRGWRGWWRSFDKRVRANLKQAEAPTSTKLSSPSSPSPYQVIDPKDLISPPQELRCQHSKSSLIFGWSGRWIPISSFIPIFSFSIDRALHP